MSLEMVFRWQNGIRTPSAGSFISMDEQKTLKVPEQPIIGFIEGDGIGPEITEAMLIVVNRAVEKAYGNSRFIVWVELLAGDKAQALTNERMPKETLEFLKECIVAIKGPLGTPVGKGQKSLNSLLRQSMDFYSAIRPVFHLGQPAPIPNPQRVNLTVFRENSDDVYAGIEFMPFSDGAKEMIEFLKPKGCDLPPDCGITIKPMSEFKTKRHVRKALRWAMKMNKKRIAVVGKGNIMKATEGAFMNWAFEVAKEPEFEQFFANGASIKGVITDQMLMQLVLKPEDYDVIITQNLNGDYISDLASALVGGPGFVPSGNIGDGYALFESTHGTATDIAGKGIANPLSLILSGAMMLEYIGWDLASSLIYEAVKKTIANKEGTPDICNGFSKMGYEARSLSTAEFAKAIADKM